jgi:hypothetical protein
MPEKNSHLAEWFEKYRLSKIESKKKMMNSTQNVIAHGL